MTPVPRIRELSGQISKCIRKLTILKKTLRLSVFASKNISKIRVSRPENSGAIGMCSIPNLNLPSIGIKNLPQSRSLGNTDSFAKSPNRQVAHSYLRPIVPSSIHTFVHSYNHLISLSLPPLFLINLHKQNTSNIMQRSVIQLNHFNFSCFKY